MNDRQLQIDRAKELLATARHAAMATVNDDGSPHNTPFMLLHDQSLTKVYWGSHPASQHSRNILRTGQLFVVLYDAHERGGLYIHAEKGHIAAGIELQEALAVHNVFRFKEGKAPLALDYYTNDSPQRMWSATITKLWVLGSERDERGLLVQDYRQAVQATDLIA